MQRIRSVEHSRWRWWGQAAWGCSEVCFRTEFIPVPQTQVPISGWSVLGELEDILGWVWGVFPTRKFSLCAQTAPWCNRKYRTWKSMGNGAARSLFQEAFPGAKWKLILPTLLCFQALNVTSVKHVLAHLLSEDDCEADSVVEIFCEAQYCCV